ncbi:MAG: KH domain-containing protein [Oscillospiraceae bacterium]|nr:KH domain-containing protein [Oscillospiraceae bacterium]
MKDLLQYMAGQLVDKPEDVRVAERSNGGELVLELRVAPSDIGKVIGRGGGVAKDLRMIVRSAAPVGKRVNVEIIETE